ncbi:hypothetical protein [Lysinibacillus sp. NPDC096259]|uniref:hypothetical protein n=1 Tax=Lysinibacillus sp. NPDC096259 TaxID=3390583 RepID=UPI003D049FFF
MGLEHGYREDIIIHPKELLRESERFGLGIVTVYHMRKIKFIFYKSVALQLVQVAYGNMLNKILFN